MRNAKTLVLVSLMFLVCSCSLIRKSDTVVEHTLSLPELNVEDLKLVPVPKVDDIFSLTDPQKKHFLAYYNRPDNQQLIENQRLSNYLEAFTNNFNFRGETLMASEALVQKAGNCLTLAILTKALADLVGLETGFQHVHTAPVYSRVQNLLTLSSHVRTYVYEPNIVIPKGFTVFQRPHIIVDYFPQRSDIGGQLISDSDFVSRFYQNMAAQALANEEYDLAYSLIRAAMSLNPFNPESLNTLAVLFSRRGNSQQAELLYQFMLENTLATGIVVSNFVALLSSQQRSNEISVYADRIDSIEERNPYRWLDMAETAYASGHYMRARKYFGKSNSLAPYLHETQFGLAKTYYQLGELEQAERCLNKALALSYNLKNKRLYQAKLMTLSTHHPD